MTTGHGTRLLVAAATVTLAAGCLNPMIQNGAASIAGTVTPASDKAKLWAIVASTSDTVTVALADSVTGAYKLSRLAPGEYKVACVGATLNASKTVVLRSEQDTTGVNFP